MRRYYLCDVIGTGSRSDPYRAIVANLGVNHVAVLDAPASAAGWYQIVATDQPGAPGSAAKLPN